MQLKSLNDRQSNILPKFKESKEPIQFEVIICRLTTGKRPEELYRSQVLRLVSQFSNN